MVHDVIMEKFDEYNEYISKDAAMLCAILDVRLLGIMNSLPEDLNELEILLENFNLNDRVTPEELKKAGVMNG